MKTDDELMDLDEEIETIELEDEDGVKTQFELLDVIEYRGKDYIAVLPPDDGITPILAVDMNANFYGDERALAEMARALGCRALRMDTNARNLRARALYARLGYSEAGIVPTTFNGIPGVQLVCLEKVL